MSLFSQVRCDIAIAAANARCGLANIGFGLQTFRCSLAANIAQCKAEADLKEAYRVAERSEKCGELEVCVPNRIRPGATVKGIFRTLFGGPVPCACGCDAAPACGCNAAPACGCEITEPACAAPAAEPTPAEEKKVSEKVEPTPAPAVTEEKAEAEEDDSEIEDNLIPEADPAAVSKNFYNPSNSIVLR